MRATAYLASAWLGLAPANPYPPALRAPAATGPAVLPQISPFARRPDVHFVPTPDRVVVAMLNLAQVTGQDVVYDLGSGDGRIPIAAAQLFGARGVGVEIDRALVQRARERSAGASVADRVVFIEGDLFEADVSGATVVTLFLLQGLNLKLLPKLRRELKPGSRIVSLNFTMGDAWPPDISQDVEGLSIHLWTVP